MTDDKKIAGETLRNLRLRHEAGGELFIDEADGAALWRKEKAHWAKAGDPSVTVTFGDLLKVAMADRCHSTWGTP